MDKALFVITQTSLSCDGQICTRRIAAFQSQATKKVVFYAPTILVIEDHVLQVSL